MIIKKTITRYITAIIGTTLSKTLAVLSVFPKITIAANSVKRAEITIGLILKATLNDSVTEFETTCKTPAQQIIPVITKAIPQLFLPRPFFKKKQGPP